jgi:hypothetical protein
VNWRLKVVQGLLSGIVLASVTGLTALAFKHPRAFARLYPYLFLAVSVLFMGFTVWHFAVHFTWTTLIPFIQQGQISVAHQSVGNLELPYVWVCGAYVFILALLWVDLKLPAFINASEGSNSTSVTKRSKE